MPTRLLINLFFEAIIVQAPWLHPKSAHTPNKYF